MWLDVCSLVGTMRRLRLGILAASTSLALGLLACSQAVEEDDAEVADSAYNQEDVDRDPTLKALQELAKDVSAYEISVAGIDVPVPNASVGTSVNGFSTRGLDWFKNPAVSYPDNKRWEQGTDTGKKCQWAAIFRFNAIFSDPPEEAIAMRELEGGRWYGSFWSWIDDYASTDSVGDPTSSYAWSSSLWKWIGASGANDTCRLPTKAMVAGMMKACAEHARQNDGDPKGCRMPRYSPEAEAAYPYDRGDAGAGDASSDATDAGAGDAATD